MVPKSQIPGKTDIPQQFFYTLNLCWSRVVAETRDNRCYKSDVGLGGEYKIHDRADIRCIGFPFSLCRCTCVRG